MKKQRSNIVEFGSELNSLTSARFDIDEYISFSNRVKNSGIPSMEFNYKIDISQDHVTDYQSDHDPTNTAFSVYSKDSSISKFIDLVHIFDERLSNSGFPESFFTIKEIDFDYYVNIAINVSLEDDFVLGELSNTERLYQEMATDFSVDALFRFFSKAISTNYGNIQFMISIANFLSTFSYDDAKKSGVDVLLTSLLPHKNDSVIEFVIRIFDNWHSSESLEILNNVKLSSQWLNIYLSSVIESIKSEKLCSS